MINQEMDSNEKLLNLLENEVKTDREIVKEIVLGKDEPEWDRSDWAMFRSKQCFKAVGVLVSLILIFAPSFIPNLQKDSQLLTGSAIGILSGIIANGESPGSNKKGKKQANKK